MTWNWDVVLWAINQALRELDKPDATMLQPERREELWWNLKHCGDGIEEVVELERKWRKESASDKSGH